jgi:broad specificity phosphatase PhoE
MSYELTLLLVRHGETTWNAEGRFQGSRDIPLSERGQEQARVLQKRLEKVYAATPVLLPGPPRAVFASPLERAFETAAILLPAIPHAPNIIPVPLLRERSFGNWEGLTTAEIREQFGPQSQPEDAEPYPDVQERIREAFSWIWRETLRDSSRATALVVGHGGSLRFFFAIALGISTEAVRRIQMENTGLSIVVFRGESPETAEGRLLLLNDTSHLAELGFAERPRATPPR